MSGNITTNGLIAICKCPIQYLELVLVLINFNNYIINIKILDFCWVSLALLNFKSQNIYAIKTFYYNYILANLYKASSKKDFWIKKISNNYYHVMKF